MFWYDLVPQIQDGRQRHIENQSGISWTKCATKANEATFPTKYDITDLMERLLPCSETILTLKSKMASQ